MKLKSKEGVIIEVNREAFDDRGQDFHGYIERMKNLGYKEIE